MLPVGARSGLSDTSLRALGPIMGHLQPPLLALFPPGASSEQGFWGYGARRGTVSFISWRWWVFHTHGEQRSALSCHPWHHALAVCLWHAGGCWSRAILVPDSWLQAGDGCPWHRPEQLSLFSQLGFFGWVWMGMAAELSLGLGSELHCCLIAPLNLLLHIRPDQMEQRNEFL